MAMFSRRILQRLLDENSHFLKKGQTKKLVEELNRVSGPSTLKKNINLSSEWEAVLLNVFGKIGKVTYEKKFDGPTYGDIYFEVKDNPGVNFLAEITAVSDKGLHERNPVEFLRKELTDIVRNRGLNPNHFSIEPGGEYHDSGRDGTKARLLLPGRARFHLTIFAKKFEKFMQNISQSLGDSCTYEINEKDIQVKIGYNPKQRGFSSGYLDYSVVFSLTRNRIYEELEKKREQLRKTGFKGSKGIFLCDGDCSLLQESILRKTSGSYTRDHIIRHFLSEDPVVVFVVIFLIEEENPKRTLLRSGPRRFKVSTQVYKGPGFDDLIGIDQIVEKAKVIFPEPERDACNAINLLRGSKPDQGSFFMGRHQLKIGDETSQITMSARELLGLLTGSLSYVDFLKIHGFDKIVNPFCIAFDKGQLIEGISIEKSDFQDDDWIVFKFKGPDPAISTFREPSAQEGKKKAGK